MERAIKVDNAYILPGDYRNFAGRPTKFNKAGGARSFCIRLNEEQAMWFKQNGFNVQEKINPSDPDAGVTYVLSVKVSFKVAPPRIVMISGNRGTELTENTVSLLDSAEVQYADLSINPYEYDVNGSHGYSAYLRELYVTIAENPYAEKYRNLVMNNGGAVAVGDDSDMMPFN